MRVEVSVYVYVCVFVCAHAREVSESVNRTRSSHTGDPHYGDDGDMSTHTHIHTGDRINIVLCRVCIRRYRWDD